MAWNDASLIGFRVVQGFAAGLIFPLMQTLAVRAAGGRASSSLIAAVSLPLALGPILGPVIGGVILNWLSWRWLFLVNVPVIAVGLVLAWRLLPADQPSPGAGRARLDLIGLGLLGQALAAILLGLSNLSQDGGIGHAGAGVPLLAGIALLGAFVGWALRPGGHPVVDVRLLRLRSLGSASAVLFTAGAALYAGMFLLPLYYQQLRGESVLDAGLLLIPQGAGSLAARFVVAKLVDRLGARLVTIASFLVAAAATVPFALAGPQHEPVAARPGAGDPRLRDRRGAHPADVGRLPGRAAGRHSARDHEHPDQPAGRRILRHRDRCGRPAVPAVPRRGRRVPGRVLVGDRHHGRGAHPRPRPARRPRGGTREMHRSGRRTAALAHAGATAGFSLGPRFGENTAVDKIPDNRGEQAGGAQTRRHGAELEAAILDAAWEQLVAEGYEHFTIDAVAARAQTSKPVLYRRWKTRDDLLRATARHRGAADAPAIPDTGTLRGDLLALLSNANTTRNPMAALVEQHARQLLQPGRPHPGRAPRGVPEPAQLRLGRPAGRRPRGRAR